jgi:hypothetical protein
LTNVTRRRSPEGWPAASEGGGSEAAGAEGEEARAGCASVAGADDRIRARVGAAVPGPAGARFVVGAAAVAAADPLPAVAVAAAETGPGPPAALVPKAAQPAVKVTAASAAVSANARACPACRLALPWSPRPARTPSRTCASLCRSAH